MLNVLHPANQLYNIIRLIKISFCLILAEILCIHEVSISLIAAEWFLFQLLKRKFRSSDH